MIRLSDDGPSIDLLDDFPDVGVRGNDDEYDTRPADRRALARFGVGESEERAISKRVRPFASVRGGTVRFARTGTSHNQSCVRLLDPESNEFNLLDEEEDGDVLRGDFRCAGGGVRGNGAQEEADG